MELLDYLTILKVIFFPHNTTLFIKDFKNNDVRYIFYLLKSLRLNRRGSGSGVPTMNRNHLHPLRIKAHLKVKTQQNIAQTLSNLDAKIELNNRINCELKAMAKLLYDYWFVQFDFPDAEGKPYKSSGGKMVYSEALKREIPEGWEVGILGDLIILHYGKPLKKDMRDGLNYPVIGSSGVIDYHSKFYVEGPGIVLGRKGTIGKVTYIDTNFFPIDTTYYVEPKPDISFQFLSFFLNDLGLDSMNSDSAVPGLNRSFALGKNTILPPVELIKKFEKKVDYQFRLCNLNTKQNQHLASLRDWLLPMLMNGQVTVGEQVE